MKKENISTVCCYWWCGLTVREEGGLSVGRCASAWQETVSSAECEYCRQFLPLLVYWNREHHWVTYTHCRGIICPCMGSQAMLYRYCQYAVDQILYIRDIHIWEQVYSIHMGSQLIHYKNNIKMLSHVHTTETCIHSVRHSFIFCLYAWVVKPCSSVSTIRPAIRGTHLLLVIHAAQVMAEPPHPSFWLHCQPLLLSGPLT